MWQTYLIKYEIGFTGESKNIPGEVQLNRLLSDLEIILILSQFRPKVRLHRDLMHSFNREDRYFCK